MHKTKCILACTALLLVGAIGLVVYGSMQPLQQTFHGSVKDLVPGPADVPGWIVEYQPIAETPEIQAKVNELLNYDDGVFVTYTQGTRRLSVYIAYWRPGKMSHRLVAGHTPDVCWVLAGWRVVLASQHIVTGKTMDSGPLSQVIARIAVLMQRKVQSIELTTHSAQLPAAEYRVMELRGKVEHVAFWHLVGGEPKSYGVVGPAPWYAALFDMISKGLRQREEQFFIRLSSNDLLSK